MSQNNFADKEDQLVSPTITASVTKMNAASFVKNVTGKFMIDAVNFLPTKFKCSWTLNQPNSYTKRVSNHQKN